MSAAPLGRDPGGLASSRPQAADLRTSVIAIPIGQQIGYRRWAPRWWWRRIQPTLVTEDAMIIAIMLSVAGLGFLCWLAFNLAVYALPF
jgi:hypothetical protein